MKLILKEDVQSLGESGDIVVVKDGFGRNYLLPQNLAEIASKGSLKNREKNLARIRLKAEKLYNEALHQAEVIKKLGKLEIEVKAGESGKLFGAITTRKLAELIEEKTTVAVDRRNISLDNPINALGEYKMLLKITSKVSVEVPVVTVASEIIQDMIVEEEIEEVTEEVVEEVVEEVAVSEEASEEQPEEQTSED